MELILKVICVGLSICMLGVAFAARRASGSWLPPACVYSIAWFLFTFIPLVTLASVPANPLAVGYILLTCIMFSVPVFLTRWTEVQTVSDEESSALFDTPFLRLCFFFFAALAFAALLINAAIQGLSLDSLTSNFFATSNALIIDRYNNASVANIFESIANVASYVAVALGGLVLAGYRSSWLRLVILLTALLPSLIVMVVFGAKGMIFLCIAMFYAGTLVRRLRRGDRRLIDSRTIRGALIGTASLLPLITISFLARGLYRGQAVDSVADGLVRYYASYSSAHLYAFSDWFNSYVGFPAAQIYAKDEVTGGFYTFMSLFRALGSDKVVPPGVYTEYYQYGQYVQTNIYTMFRGLIVDFTLPGSLVVSLIAGSLCNAAFVSMCQSRFSVVGVIAYIAMAGYIYTSFIISLLIWNSIYPMLALLAVILWLNNIQFRSKRPRAFRPQLFAGDRSV